MKKLFLLAVMAIMTLTASAEDIEQGFRMGVKAQVGMTGIGEDGTKMSLGYGVGWIAEYNVSSNFFVQSGIGIDNIGYKMDGIDGNLNGYYLNVPINAGYRFNLGESSKLFLQAGPYLGYGIAGTKIEWVEGGDSNYFDLAKKFDFGLGARVGVEMSKIQVSVGTNYGVLKVFDGGGHNFSVNLGVAYMF